MGICPSCLSASAMTTFFEILTSSSINSSTENHGAPSPPQKTMAPFPDSISMIAIAPSSPPSSPTAHLPPSSIASGFSSFFTLGHVLDASSSATVYRCTRIADGAEYACRRVHKARIRSQLQLHGFLKEVSVMRKLSTESTEQELRCILKLHEVVQDAGSFYLITDLCSGGNLDDRLAKRKLIRNYDDTHPTVHLFTEAEAASITKCLLEALQTFHSRDIVHGNVESRNILFVEESDKEVSVKLSGFELATVSGRSFLITSMRTPISVFTAPETVKAEGAIYGKHVDLWRVGVVLYILLFGVPPFSGQNEESLRLSILYSHVPFSDDVDWSSVSALAKTLLHGLLCRDPALRMTASEALEHPWILAHCTTRS